MRHLLRGLSRHRQPLVSVVVWTPDGAGFVEECLASVRASARVRTEIVKVAESASIDRAVELATGELIGFVSADDVVTPDGLAVLVEALSAGADVAVGHRERHRGGKTVPLPPAGGPTDLMLSGKLFRLSSWRAAGVRVGSWEAQERATAQMLRSAQVVVVTDVVCVEHERNSVAPSHEQRRFRADLARTRFAALSEILRETDPGWRLDAVQHLLPELCRDSVGGGPAYFWALQPFAREVLDGVEGLPADQLLSAPVADRLLSWVAAHGSLTDVALTLDHLQDNPNGLPGTDRLTDAPTGLAVALPEEWRALGPGDRRLRSRVLDLQPLGRDRVRLLGNAFVEQLPTRLPRVQVSAGGRTLDVEVHERSDERANEWSARAWEDRRDSGFQAEVSRTDLPHSRSGVWSVRVSLGGHDTDHQVRMLQVDPSPDPVVDAITLGPVGVQLRGTGEPVRLRLAGPRGTTPWSDVEPEPESDGPVGAVGAFDGRFEVMLRLSTPFFDDQTLPPGGRYLLEAQDSRGRLVPVTWSAGLLACPPDLVGERLGLRLAEDREVAGLVVGRPLSAEDRSAFGTQQRINAYVAVPRSVATATVLLESFHGRVVGDNPAAIGSELAGRSGPFDLAWVVDDPGVNVPEGTRAVPQQTQAWFDGLAGAHAYVSNAAAPPWFRKHDGQFHLQTWHGTPLKKIGEDRGPGDFNTWRHRRRVAGQSAGWDAMISPSPYCSEIFRSAFRYDGPMLEIGYPRNDVLVSERGPRLRARTRHRLGLTDADRVLLYAPTWREYLGVRDSKPLLLDPVELLAELPDAVVLVRGHYNASRQPDLFLDRPRIIDVTRYPDVADLYLAADWLVTDYSSVMFDFALTDKPMVLLTPDLDRYRDVERGFYFDIEADPPGPMVTTTADVAQRLSGPDEHAASRRRFRDRFCPYDDGHAAERAVDHLLASW